MGGGGSIGYMNAVIKNNRKLLKGAKKRKQITLSFSKRKVEFKVSETSPHKLKRLRNRLQNEHKYLRQKQLFIFGLLMVIMLIVIFYYL